MKLTQKDKEFLERLAFLLEERDLYVELAAASGPRMVLRKNYGDRIERAFDMTRQGVRWRFNRVFNEMYVESYRTVLWVESRFGTGLREKAMQIARDRARHDRDLIAQQGMNGSGHVG